MSLANYRFAIEKLRNNGVKIDYLMPASDALIGALEQRLGADLPVSYKAMLSEFGILGFGGNEFYGLGRTGLDGKNAPSVVFTTERSRKDGEISDTMIRIKASGYGPYFVIDCAQVTSPGEAAIFELDERGMSHGSELVADSFGTFLLEHVNEHLTYRT
ncbi:SMI1/KNR4 family protein [Rhizobium tumorigenes]|uniref:SMI1/KNR4 family protein n=1 Tax=Rhizobium tumorigenes TaxID=2041385 RepID=A0AAF1KEM8_9HYPH|nr:SMI1/KNR4 family protein [Rhizobium tumorigenes]WFR98761.1 SMI1/KNR4 family protein [Rhizobium tumorigenes]